MREHRIRMLGGVRGRGCGCRNRRADQAECQSGKLERDTLAAAPLASRGRRRGRARTHRGDDPRFEAVAWRGHPARTDRDRNAPTLEDGVEIKAGRTSTDVGATAGAGHGAMWPDDFPEDDRTPHHGTRLAENFAFVTTKYDCAQQSSIGHPVIGRRVGAGAGAPGTNCGPLQRRQAETSVWPMTNPPQGFPSRPSVGRSSFAVAMKDYTFIRPGIAVTISAGTLALALVIGIWLIFSLREAAQTVARGAHTSETLHRYSAGVEVWREMSTSADPRFQRTEAVAQRDSLGRMLRAKLADLSNDLPKQSERDLVQTVLGGLTSTSAGARQDRSEEHTSELQSRSDLVCRLLLEKKKSEVVGRKAIVGSDAIMLS